MIVFDLRCGNAHVFEAWFGSSASYEAQRAEGLLSCPICGDDRIAKAVMAPNVAAKGNRRKEAMPASLPAVTGASGSAVPTTEDQAAKLALAMVARAQAALLERSQWVGRSFADKARAMHLGDEPEAPIHGQATVEQARALIDEGVPVAPLIIPVAAPDTLN